ncbi:MAG: hypothetical protein HOB38_20410 [Deltaproteobacteria bacterium]|nr:hypothetical protein [Deltaproteobacteria bacterium]
MFEDVLQFGKKLLFIDKFQSLEIQQAGFEFISNIGDGVQDFKSKIPPDNRCHLHRPFQILFQAVHSGGDDTLHGIGDLNIFDVSQEHIHLILLFNGSVFQ